MKHVVCLLLLTGCFFHLPAQNGQPEYTSYLQAHQLLNKAIKAHGGLLRMKRPVHFTAAGEYYQEDHLPHPEERITYARADTVYIHPAIRIGDLRSTLTTAGKTYRSKALLKADSAHVQEYSDTALVVSPKSANIRTVFSHMLPATILLEAMDQATTLSYTGKTVINGKPYELISYNAYNGDRYTLYFSLPSLMLYQLTHLGYGPIYGDQYSIRRFERYTRVDSVMVPQAFTDTNHGQVTMRLSLRDFSYESRPSAAPDTTQLTLDAIAPLLYQISIPEVNDKVMVADMGPHLAVFEAPVSSEISRKVIQAIRQTLPGKKIKYLFVSHHHPDHAGGIREYVLEGCTIVTSAYCKNYFTRVIRTPHTLAGDDRSSANRTPVYDTIPTDSVRVYPGVTVYNIGGNTGHTPEYLLFYFPSSKILLAGDLLYLPANSTKKYINRRTASIRLLIRNHQLKVDKIYTSWPLKDQRPYGTTDDL